MFLAVIAFTLNSLRNYFMLNHQNLNDDDDSDDDETGIKQKEIFQKKILHSFSGNSNILDKIRSIITYICTYLWCISFILLIFIIYASLRGPFNIIDSFNTGKNSKCNDFY
jgi:hypothetical protein